MEAIIERTPVTTNQEHGKEVAVEFMCICEMITASNTEGRLREGMSQLLLNEFVYGFGGNHMWVFQVGGVEERNIIVYF